MAWQLSKTMSTSGPAYDSKTYTLFRAEAFIAALLDHGFSYDKIDLQLAGSFAKSYRNDIESVKQYTDDHDQEILRINLNRDSIYDRLPEGLFHQPRANGGKVQVTQMVAEHRRLKEEEKAARRFFRPLEQELFRYSVLVEQEERDFMAGMLSGRLDNAFSRFWNLRSDLPEELTAALARMMPWAYLIKGDAPLCAKALGIILGKPVQVAIRIIEEHRKEECYILGEGELGIDTLSGSTFAEPAVCWVFTIGGLDAGGVSAFVGDEQYGRFLQQFVDIFIPLEADAAFEYNLALGATAGVGDILGYSFVL